MQINLNVEDMLLLVKALKSDKSDRALMLTARLRREIALDECKRTYQNEYMKRYNRAKRQTISK